MWIASAFVDVSRPTACTEYGIFVPLAVSRSSLKTTGEMSAPRLSDRAAAHLVLADLLLLDLRMIGREGDVDDDRHLRVDAVRADERAAAVPGDLLLRRRGGDDACRPGFSA